MAIQPSRLTNEAAARTGYTHSITIRDEDFTSTGNTQTFTVAIAANTLVGKVFHRLTEDFDSSDATLTSLTYIVGDGGSTNRFLTSTEVCVDGTEVDAKLGALSDWYLYTSADTIDIAFTGTSAKDLSTLNQGELVILIQILEADEYIK